MRQSMVMEAKKIWEKISMTGSVQNLQFEIELQKKLLNFFHVGKFYYYIFDVSNGCFKYISPAMREVLGFDPEKITIEEFFSYIHPEDQPTFLNFESVVVDFFAKLPSDKLTKYKFTYDYRIRDSSGKYIRLLQQVMTVQFDGDLGLLITLGVHTDITHIKNHGRSSLSFIGLEGEPSFIDVDVKKVFKSTDSFLSNREREILQLILDGRPTCEIAKQLFISTHTVNTHRKNILAKTNSKSAMELASKVIKGGLL